MSRVVCANRSLILVVDDHPTNRLVIRQQLDLLGYSADIFDNAAEALSAWATGAYGLILTDCFMPDMDGYALTRRIREQEKDRNLKRTPIIAFSAAVLSGEQEKSLAAGMDDFLAKPVDLDTIARKLEKWLPQTHQRGRALDSSHERVTPVASSSNAIDIDVLMASFSDLETSKSILQNYLVSYHEDIAQLARAIEKQDHGAVERLAHRMKGAARTIGAKPYADWCFELEKAGRNGDETNIQELWRRFKSMDAEIKAGIAAMSYSHPPA